MDTVVPMEPNKEERELGVISGRCWLAEFSPGKASVMVALETQTTVLYGAWTSELGRHTSPATMLKYARQNAVKGFSRIRAKFAKDASLG